jgi:hypothetical protein
MSAMAGGKLPSLEELVHRWAPVYKVDPLAALKVSRVEGGGKWGAVGDQGTSFGPWQLHIGGAMPAQYATPSAAAAFANSEEGVKYVLSHMGRVAGGLTGNEAIAAIVRKFERPADPEGEIARATGVSVAPGGFAPGGFPPMAAAAPRPLAPLGFSPGLTQSLAALTGGAAGAGGDPGLQLLGQTLGRQRQFANQYFKSQRPAAARPQAPGAPPVPGFEAAPESETWLTPGAKIIGLPGQGTHTVGNWQSDNAIDIAVPKGTPIYAPVSGKLGNTGLLPGAGASGGGRFSGERINLFGGGQGFYFAHLSQLAPGIKQGAAVKAGQLLGYTGEANGVQHLHFGVEKGDPRSYYG